MNAIKKSKLFRGVDWLLFFFIVPLLGAGLVTMNSFVTTQLQGGFFEKQLLWIALSLIIFFVFSTIDFRFLKQTNVLVTLYLIFTGLLLFLFVFGSTIKGATSWFDLGGFSFQPSDLMKLIVVLMLAKYFSRRHVEIANVKHILVSGLYALIPFVLVFLQPDFGSAVVIFLIWLGMVMVSGISKKHLAVVFTTVALISVFLWSFVFQPYQKARIQSFIYPLTDISGTGYNAYQSTIAVGSGQLLGKGVGYGTQSRLQFLPEYETDFIFAAFAEEWGFVGSILVFILYGLVIWRILANALLGASNFEMLYGIGVAIFFMSHIVINIGMNIGLLPVTGITLPFMSYGGSHLVTEFAALGILMGMRNYRRRTHRDDLKNEFLGIE
ncbi:rod shape-determining protein RodA [Candidatus Wolfebacteria bacterium]|nr:MAG: rod shape-determining protein RodA [Candidatus Wolfebacteria bacterium]